MKIARDAFFRRYRLEFGKIESKAKVKRISSLLSQIESDNALNKHIFDMSYVLATIHHEVGGTYKPIREWGRGKGRRYGKPDKKTGEVYYGRGYVQLTWDWNYKKLSTELKRYRHKRYQKEITHFLYYFPDKALQPSVAYDIISLGMRRGLFTGRKLSQYRDKNDYRNARRIVNGLDKAELIAKYARRFKRCLKDSIINKPLKFSQVSGYPSTRDLMSDTLDNSLVNDESITHKESIGVKILRVIRNIFDIK